MQAVLLLFLVLSASALPKLSSSTSTEAPTTTIQIDPATPNTGIAQRRTQKVLTIYFTDYHNKQCSGKPARGQHAFEQQGSDCLPFNPTLTAFKVNWNGLELAGASINYYATADCSGPSLGSTPSPDNECEVLSEMKAPVRSAKWVAPPPVPVETIPGCGMCT